MTVLDVYGDSIRANTLADLSKPAPPEDGGFSAWSFLRSGFKAPVAAGLETLATVRDISRGVDETYEASRREQAKRTGSVLAPRTIGEGGDALRARADAWLPDPLTAHWAEQAVAGFTRFGAKALLDVGLLGPVAGTAALALDEGNTATQRLKAKGVDSETAAKVGAVQGVLSAAGAVMPLAGSTVAKTAALVVAGGPAQFMATEGLSREILQRAGYADEAKLHDPFDPIGLGISTALAGVAGAAGMRGRIKALKTEADMRAAVALTPAEQKASDAFERSAGNLAELRAAIAAEKRPEAKALLQEELARLEAKTTEQAKTLTLVRAAADPMAVDAARVKVLDDVVARSLPPDDPAAMSKVLKAADAIGAGDDIPDFSAAPVVRIKEAAEIADDLRGMADNAFWSSVGGRIIRDPSTAVNPNSPDAIYHGDVTARTKWIPAEEWFGRMRKSLDRDGLSNQGEIKRAVEKAIAGEPLTAKEQRTVDWMRAEQADMARKIAASRGLDDADALASDAFGAGLSSKDAESVALVARAAEFDEAALERAAIQFENDDGLFLAEVWRIVSEGEQRQRETANTRTGADAGRAQAPAAPPPSPIAAAARKAYDEHLASGRTLAATLAERADTPPAVRNLMIGLEEAGDDATRQGALLRAFDAAQAREPGRPPEDIAADVVEQARVQTDASAGKPADPLAAVDQTAVAQLVAERPDMEVRLPGDEKNTTLKEALDRIKAEQEDEAGFAELVRVAATCAITGGAAT